MDSRFGKPSATAGRVGTDGPRRLLDATRSGPVGLALRSWVAVSIVIVCGREVGGGENVPPRPARVDPAVTPAGGARAAHADCRECRRAACPQCRLAEDRHPGHGPCQHGLCPAHCPVRPDVFGFYGTQWRRWPGSNVIRVSRDEAAAPARPPRSIVPMPFEESLETAAEPQPLPPPAAADTMPTRPMPPRDVEAAGREQGRALGRELGRPASDPAAPVAPPQTGSPPSRDEPRESRRDDDADATAEPPETSALEKPADRPGVAPESLSNLDERPQAAPWRSFTAKARLDARERR